MEPGGLCGRAHRLKARQLVAHTPEGLIAIHCRAGWRAARRERRLVGAEANVIAFHLAHCGHMPETAQPLLRQQTVGAIVERDHGLAAFRAPRATWAAARSCLHIRRRRGARTNPRRWTTETLASPGLAKRPFLPQRRANLTPPARAPRAASLVGASSHPASWFQPASTNRKFSSDNFVQAAFSTATSR